VGLSKRGIGEPRDDTTAGVGRVMKGTRLLTLFVVLIVGASPAATGEYKELTANEVA
jgi:hypothetical protein